MSATTARGAAQPRRIPESIRWRRYHRWFSTGSMVVLGWVSVTGVALGIDVWASGRTHPELETASAPLPREAAARWAGEAGGLLAHDPAGRGMESAQLVLRMREGGARIRMVAAGRIGTARHEIEIAAHSGTVLSRREIPAEQRAPKWRSALHRLLEDLHRGTIIGLPGQLLSLLAGLSFVFLTGTGLWLYLDMWRKRRRAGKTSLFWSR